MTQYVSQFAFAARKLKFSALMDRKTILDVYSYNVFVLFLYFIFVVSGYLKFLNRYNKRVKVNQCIIIMNKGPLWLY